MSEPNTIPILVFFEKWNKYKQTDAYAAYASIAFYHKDLPKLDPHMINTSTIRLTPEIIIKVEEDSGKFIVTRLEETFEVEDLTKYFETLMVEWNDKLAEKVSKIEEDFTAWNTNPDLSIIDHRIVGKDIDDIEIKELSSFSELKEIINYYLSPEQSEIKDMIESSDWELKTFQAWSFGPTVEISQEEFDKIAKEETDFFIPDLNND